MVVIVEADEVAELQVTSSAASFAGDTFLGAAITEDTVCVVVEQVISWLVEHGTGVSLGDGKTNGVGDTLTQRTGGDFDTGGIVRLGVTRGDTAKLLGEISFFILLSFSTSTYTEGLEVVEGDAVSIEVEQSVLQHASVTVASVVRPRTFI